MAEGLEAPLLLAEFGCDVVGVRIPIRLRLADP